MDHEAGPRPLISRDEMRERVDHAVSTEKFMMRLGWIVLFFAVGSLVVAIVLWLHGDITFEQALASIFGVIISAILSGAAAYSSGVNVGLGASRLALALEQDQEADDRGEA